MGCYGERVCDLEVNWLSGEVKLLYQKEVRVGTGFSANLGAPA